MKIVFLFLDKSYCIYHSIGIALELAKNSNHEIHLVCSPKNATIIRQLLADGLQPKNLFLKILRPYWFIQLPHYLEIKFQFRSLYFFKYRPFFQRMDAFVCTIYDDLNLKKYLPSTSSAKFFFTNHGIPNRAYSFDNKILQFDMFFLLGKKELDFRKKLHQIQKDNYAITGFLKGDFLQKRKAKSFFANGHPTIIYNPHWDKRFSSFFQNGAQILDFFVKNPSYNLIFAPHSLLYTRNWGLYFKLKKYQKYSNIYIDWGSERANDMTYTRSADIYLGDISSQVFEFLYHKKRPCIFIDAHQLRADKANRPLSWDLGIVLSNMQSFEPVLKTAFAEHQEKWNTIQSQFLAETFYLSANNANQIAAEAIQQYLIMPK